MSGTYGRHRSDAHPAASLFASGPLLSGAIAMSLAHLALNGYRGDAHPAEIHIMRRVRLSE